MSFNSPQFLIYVVITAVGHFTLPHRLRWGWLLASSLIFYATWSPLHVLLLVLSTLVAYLLALQIGRTSEPAGRKAFLILGLLVELGMLATFKYWGFVHDSFGALLGWFGLTYTRPAWQPLFPAGISFFTFQASGYLIDVYRAKIEPERHLGVFGLFAAFFPQLVAGPIERAGHLIPQFRVRHKLDASRISGGLSLLLWGMFKKVVVADRLAVYVSAVYGDPAAHRGWPVILATYFFAVQIYCDFSAYTDIVRGAAKLLGYDLLENFGLPYTATSIRDFWRRWHMSLTSWFRDYLYIPLGGNRVSKARWYANLMIVFLLSGLWHGPQWTFVLWGGLHGLYMLLEAWTHDLRARVARRLHLTDRILWTALSTIVVLNLVCFAWIFFRAGSIFDAALLIANMVQLGASTDLHQPWTVSLGSPNAETALALGLVALMALVHFVRRYPQPAMRSFGRRSWARWIVYLFLAWAILNLGLPQETPFVYLQF
jgi:D-alanyl-lipoteichoic acid acyltransferase DltB (MBOAT superfamily)